MSLLSEVDSAIDYLVACVSENKTPNREFLGRNFSKLESAPPLLETIQSLCDLGISPNERDYILNTQAYLLDKKGEVLGQRERQKLLIKEATAAEDNYLRVHRVFVAAINAAAANPSEIVHVARAADMVMNAALAATKASTARAAAIQIEDIVDVDADATAGAAAMRGKLVAPGYASQGQLSILQDASLPGQGPASEGIKGADEMPPIKPKV